MNSRNAIASSAETALVRSTPTLASGLLDVFAGFERLVCRGGQLFQDWT
jgi:hypothetical protein